MPARTFGHSLWPERFLRDLSYAWRGLRRERAFAATTVLTLSVGLALITVVFTVFDAYVLRPFAVRDPYRLHVLGWEARDAQGWRFNWREFQELRGRSDLFDDASAERTQFVTAQGRQLFAGFVSGNYFDMLGARVSRGRPLAEFDVRVPGTAPVAVLSDPAWSRIYDRDPDAIGRTIELNQVAVVIVGVMRPEFAGLDDSPRDLWVPLTMYRDIARLDLFGPKGPREMVVTARLRDGVSKARAEAALTTFMATSSGRSDAVRPSVLLRATPSPISLELLAMISPVFAAFALVLIAACANVSNVMLARANARHREIAVRISLGAGRARIVQQLLTEGLVIAALGGLAGLGIAAVVLRAGLTMFIAMMPPSVGELLRVVPLDFDYRVFLFAGLAAAVTTLMFALLPALQATRGVLSHALRSGAGASPRASKLRGLLVTGQVTVSLVILIAAATLVRNGMVLRQVNLGMQTAGVVSVQPDLREPGLIRSAALTLAADPRVESVAVTSVNPLFEQYRQVLVTPADVVSSFTTRYTFVSPEYFPILRIRIVRGREFRPDEASSEAHVAIISAAAARTFWPGADPIGKQIQIEHPGSDTTDKLPGYREVVVVGVASDVVSGFVYDGTDPAHLYLPTTARGSHAAALLVRGRDSANFRQQVVPLLLQRVHEDRFAFQSLPLTEVLALQMFPLRIASSIGALLAAIAMALSVSGLYGVLTYMLSQRTREIGIRMALGATSARVLRLVMRQCLQLASLGVALGVVSAFVVMHLLSTVIQMRNVSVVNASAFVGAVALVSAAALLSAYIPARRATRIDPSQALRAEP
jgi:predicted permease